MDTKPCPDCGYDVSTTLDDGLDACPECGGAIDEASCAHVGGGVPLGAFLLRLRWGAYAAFPVGMLHRAFGYASWTHPIDRLSLIGYEIGQWAQIVTPLVIVAVVCVYARRDVRRYGVQHAGAVVFGTVLLGGLVGLLAYGLGMLYFKSLEHLT